MLIKEYFKVHGISILEARYTSHGFTIAIPCGAHTGVSYYFLVSQSDVDKMRKLGYGELATPLPQDASPIQ